MGYLASLLSCVNEQTDVIFVGTGIILSDSNKRLFLARRADNNEWSFPGGTLEVGETLEECAVRELREETGIVIKASDLHFNAVKFIQEPIVKNGRTLHTVSVTFWATEFDATDFEICTRELNKYGWFSREELCKIDNMTAYAKVAMEEYYK